MRKHWLAMVAIGLSVCACDEAVNVDCGEGGCQFSDDQFSDGECQDGDIRCTSDKKGYLKCRENRWSDFEVCEENKLCDENQDKCVDDCKDNDFECIDDSAASYRVCENKDWVFKECDSGKICQNNQCIGPEVTEECQADAFECTGEFSYRTCVEEKWAEGNCENGKVCQNNACIPQPTSCEGSVFLCTDKFNYRKCVENKWVNEKCEDGKVCQNNACVPPEPSDCNEGKFLGCTQDKTQKQIQICNPQNVKNEPCDPGMICDTQSGGCIYTPAPPSDSCSYDKIKGELAEANLGCDDASKTFIISSSTNLSQLNNWHDNEKKSCLVFCGEIHLDTLTDSIPLPPNAKVVGVKEAKLGAEEVKEAKLSADELSKPLFKSTNKDEAPIQSIYFKGFDLQINLKVSQNGAHGVLANEAENVIVKDILLTGELTHNDDQIITEVGGLFGVVTGDSDLNHITLNKVNINLQPNRSSEDNDSKNNKSIGGIIGSAPEGKLTIINSSISDLTINSGLAANVGGMIGDISSNFEFKVDGDDASKNTINGLTISNAERNAGAVLGYCGKNNSNNDITIHDTDINLKSISAKYDCAGGLIGYIHKGKFNANNVKVRVSETISAAKNVGGLIGYIDHVNTSITNTDIHTNNIKAKIIDKYDTSGSCTGGLLGRIHTTSDKTDLKLENIKVISNSIVSEKNYAGGLIGIIGINYNGQETKISSTIKSTSSFSKEIKANQYAGGLIGFISKNTESTKIEKIQNVVETLSISSNIMEPGGLIGYVCTDDKNKCIKKIEITSAVSYSQRTKDNSRTKWYALLKYKNCEDNKDLFKAVRFYSDYKFNNSNSYACGQDVNFGNELYRIQANTCKQVNITGFNCRKIKINGNTITIPLFDTSMLDEDGNIQW